MELDKLREPREVIGAEQDGIRYEIKIENGKVIITIIGQQKLIGPVMYDLQQLGYIHMDTEIPGKVAKEECPATNWREVMEGFQCSCGFEGWIKGDAILEPHYIERPATIADMFKEVEG